MSGFELGIFTFGELTKAPGGTPSTAHERIADILEWARVADSSGLDVFGVGEHHRPDFAISSPQVVLSAGSPDEVVEKILADHEALGTSTDLR